MAISRGRIAALCLALLSGCTQWHYDLGRPLQATEFAEHTPVGEVMAELGPPLRMSATPGGYVLAWEYWQVWENTLGFSLGAMGADFMSVDVGNAKVRGHYLLLSFDTAHLLQGAEFSYWEEQAGSGSAVQPLFGFVDVVDVDDLVGSLPQHRWGAESLLRLPQALNRASRPETGAAGTEQRGTPTGAGQRSLEYH